MLSAAPCSHEGCADHEQARLSVNRDVKTTRYFEEQVLRKRPYIQRAWCERALREPARRELQADGRVRYWILIAELGRYLRVVTLEDGETIHNAFLDRDFQEPSA